MEQKKATKSQIERKIKNAVVFFTKDKDTQSIFFDDKGVRLTVTTDTAVIETGAHKHVFDSFTASGISRPYLYTKRIVELANENDCSALDSDGKPNGYSYAILLNTLRKKDDKSEYNIAYYFSWYMLNVFSPLYSIGESEVESFMVYFDYCCNIAKSAVMLSEKTEDVTNKQFIERFVENVKEFTDGLDESVLFHKKTDDEVMQENIEAIQEQELNEQIHDDGSKD